MSEWRRTEAEKAYFVTLTVVDWVDIFIRPVYADILFNNLRYCQTHKGLKLYAFVLMTSHVHAILNCREKPLGQLLRDIKSQTAKSIYEEIQSNPKESRKEWLLAKLHGHGLNNPQNERIQLWQQGNHPLDLYSREMIDQKMEYIHDNPVRAGFVTQQYHYTYSSASADFPLKLDAL